MRAMRSCHGLGRESCQEQREKVKALPGPPLAHGTLHNKKSQWVRCSEVQAVPSGRWEASGAATRLVGAGHPQAWRRVREQPEPLRHVRSPPRLQTRRK